MGELLETIATIAQRDRLRGLVFCPKRDMLEFMKTVIVDIAPANVPKEDLEARMAELESLVSTYGGITVVKRVQKRDSPDYSTYVGSGKLEELIAAGEEL